MQLVLDLAFSSVKPEDRIQYKPGDSVLCKWVDRKMYPATILKQVSEGKRGVALVQKHFEINFRLFVLRFILEKSVALRIS